MKRNALRNGNVRGGLSRAWGAAGWLRELFYFARPASRQRAHVEYARRRYAASGGTEV